MSKTRKTTLFGIVLLPVAAHAWAVWGQDRGRPLSTLDVVFSIGVIVYVALAVVSLRNARLLPRLALATYACLAAIGIAEIALRSLYPPPVDSAPLWPGVIRNKIHDSVTGVTGESVFSVNKLGLRGPPTRLENADLRILCVGGSTTLCYYVSDRETWPWQLQDILADRLKKKVFVGNSGVRGHFTLHHRHLLNHYPAARRFDWVLVLCGINDMGRLLRDDYEARARNVPFETMTFRRENGPYYTRSFIWRVLRQAGERLMSGSSTATPTDGIERIPFDSTGEILRTLRSERAAMLERNPQNYPPPNLESALARYRENLKEIIASCRSLGVGLVMMTQPTMYHKKMSPELDALIWQRTAEGAHTPELLAEVMGRFNRSLQDVCKKEEIPCVDLASMLPRDATVFIDDCHFNTSGCAKVARILADRLTEIIASKPPGAATRK